MAVQTRSGRLSDYLLQADSAEEKATVDIPYILGVTSQRPPTLARSPELLALMITSHRKKRLGHRGDSAGRRRDVSHFAVSRRA